MWKIEFLWTQKVKLITPCTVLVYTVSWHDVLQFICAGPLLCTKDELSQITTTQAQAPLSPNLYNKVLNQVQVLLLTVNKNEFNATKSYLEPLKGHDSVFTHHHRLDSPHSLTTDTAIYYLGQYGGCVAAISKIDPDSTLRTGASFAPHLAYHCFLNLELLFVWVLLVEWKESPKCVKCLCLQRW